MPPSSGMLYAMPAELGLVTREEFAMLQGLVGQTQRRLDAIDQVGTRGVGALAVQISEVIKDVAGLQQELRDHGRLHEAEAAQRTSARRWMVGTGIAFLAAVEVPLLYLITAAHH